RCLASAAAQKDQDLGRLGKVRFAAIDLGRKTNLLTELDANMHVITVEPDQVKLAAWLQTLELDDEVVVVSPFETCHEIIATDALDLRFCRRLNRRRIDRTFS